MHLAPVLERPALVQDESALGALGWVLVILLALVVFGFIGFSFNT